MPVKGELTVGAPVEVDTPVGAVNVPSSIGARLSIVGDRDQSTDGGATVAEPTVAAQPVKPWETRAPGLTDFQDMWGAAHGGDSALDRLVLRPRARQVIGEVNTYLDANGLEDGEKGMKILSLVGSTGDGKTSVADAIVQRAQARGIRTMDLDPLDLLSGTAHASQRAFRTDINDFLSEAIREAKLEGRNAKAVIVLNEGHAFLSRTEGDPEWRQRAAALNNLVDQYAKRQDVQIVFVVTSRFPLAPDVQRRAAAWTLEMTDPRPAERALAMYNLLKRSIGRKSGTSRSLDDEVVEAVKHLGSLDAGKLGQIMAQLEEAANATGDEYDEEDEETSQEHAWAARLFGLVRATRGFAFGDITELVSTAKLRARQTNTRVSFDLMMQVASELRPSIEDRHEEEAREAVEMGLRTRRTGAAA